MLRAVHLVQGLRQWVCYLDPAKIAVVEATNQSQSPDAQKARILIDGVWLHTAETVEQILELTK